MINRLGIVEGYYGNLSTFEQRKLIVKTLSTYNLNFYLYAPKEDPFLRSHIDIDHSDNWFAEFENFLGYAKDLNIEVGIGLAPTKSSNITALKKKINNFTERGVNCFSILFDDIEENFSFNDQLNIFREIKSEFPNLYFDFCPTVYSKELIEKDSIHKNYFEQFIQGFPRSEEFFWTGEKVISTNMDASCQEELHQFENENIAIWDNYFTIDSQPKKLNISYFDYLDKTFLTTKKCYVVNLTGMPRHDNLIINLMGSFVAGKKDSFESILLKHGVDERFLEFIELFDPKNKMNLKKEEKDKIHKIMFTWFHPLKNEWYPYLHNLKNWE